MYIRGSFFKRKDTTVQGYVLLGLTVLDYTLKSFRSLRTPSLSHSDFSGSSAEFKVKSPVSWASLNPTSVTLPGL